jgi:hypothetical protein
VEKRTQKSNPMNTRKASALHASVLSFVLLSGSGVFAQNYSIAAHTIAGGGGTSSGGAYAITGAIAQHDAHTASVGGAYAISGGFFSQYYALQQIGAPRLTIRGVAGGNVQLVWAANVPGWVLQSNTDNLSSAGWIDVVGTPTVSGAEQFLEFTTALGKVFFRLRKL